MSKPARKLAPRALELSDGAVARVSGDALELIAPDGVLLVRYENGVMRIGPARGDLELAAPQGRVVISAALDVAIEASRDLTQKAARNVAIESNATKMKSAKLDVETKDARLVSGQATVLARKIATSAEAIATKCVTMEVEARKLVERTKDAFRDVADLAQTRVGRARTIVRDMFSLDARRTVMTSKEDTSIDGEKILIG